MHEIIECTKCDRERQYMKEELRETGVQELSIKSLMNLPSGSSSRVFFDFIRQAGLMGRILISGQTSGAEGRGNASNTLIIPTAVIKKKSFPKRVVHPIS